MKSLRRTLALGSSLVALSLALGCQIPFLGGAAQPNVLVNFGSLSILPTASLAIAMRFDGNQFKVQDLQTSNVQKVVVTVMGPNLAQPMTVTVTRDHFSENKAIANFTNLPEGPVSVAASAIDANGTVLSYASGTATIVKGQTAVLTLLCQTTGGSLQVIYDCPDCTTASPSPAPSPIPTATPVPTPLPSPTATPSPTPYPIPLNTSPKIYYGQPWTVTLPASDSLVLFARLDNTGTGWANGMQASINNYELRETPINHSDAYFHFANGTSYQIWNSTNYTLLYSPDFVTDTMPAAGNFYVTVETLEAYRYKWNIPASWTNGAATMSLKVTNAGAAVGPIVVGY